MVLAKAEKRNGLYFAAESHSALNTHKYLSPFQVVKFTYMFEAFFDTKKVFYHEFFHIFKMILLLRGEQNKSGLASEAVTRILG